jgi:hypothetical protein
MFRRATLIVSLVLLACVAAARAENAPSAAEADTSGWTEFQAPDRGFSVSFPGTPKTSSVSVAGQNPLVQYDYTVGVGDNTVYQVVAFQYPEGKAPIPDSDYYVKLVNAYAKGSDSRLRKKGSATISGKDGYEALAEDNKGKLVHLIDVVPGSKDRIYMLITAGPKGHAGSDDAERFRESFKLLDDQAQPGATSPESTGTTSEP